MHVAGMGRNSPEAARSSGPDVAALDRQGRKAHFGLRGRCSRPCYARPHLAWCLAHLQERLRVLSPGRDG